MCDNPGGILAGAMPHVRGRRPSPMDCRGEDERASVVVMWLVSGHPPASPVGGSRACRIRESTTCRRGNKPLERHGTARVTSNIQLADTSFGLVPVFKRNSPCCVSCPGNRLAQGAYREVRPHPHAGQPRAQVSVSLVPRWSQGSPSLSPPSGATEEGSGRQPPLFSVGSRRERR